MDAIFITSIVVTMVVLVSATAVVMGNKAIASNYDKKIEDVVTQVNSSQKSSFNYSQRQGRQIDRQQSTIDDVVKDVDNMVNKTTVMDENLTGLQIDYATYTTQNTKDVNQIKDTIKKMPWDQQIQNVDNLKKRIGAAETSIGNLQYVDANHDAKILTLTSKTNDIDSKLTSTRKDYDGFKSSVMNAFYTIDGSFVKTDTLNARLKDFTVKEANDAELSKIWSQLNDTTKQTSVLTSSCAQESWAKSKTSDLTNKYDSIQGLVNQIKSNYVTTTDLTAALDKNGKPASESVVQGLSSRVDVLEKDKTNYASKADITAFKTAAVPNGKSLGIEGDAQIKGDLVFNGTNKWIVHTPDDGRQTMYIANQKNGAWDWGKQTRFEPTGDIWMSAWADAQNVTGRDHVRAGNWAAWMRNNGDMHAANRMGVGISPDSMGTYRHWVETPTADNWQGLYRNGNKHVYLNHGAGYGMHINTNNQEGGKYLMELHNGAKQVMGVYNDGRVLVNGANVTTNDGHTQWIGRHLDSWKGWPNEGDVNQRSLFLGWQGKKVVLGNNAHGGHEWVRDSAGFDSVTVTNPLRCYSWMDAHEVVGRAQLRAGGGPSWHPGDNTGAFGTILHANGQIRSRANPGNDWAHKLYAGEDHVNVHMAHPGGYGIHTNTRNRASDKYGLEVHNGEWPVLQSWNDGRVNIRNRLWVEQDIDARQGYFGPDNVRRNYGWPSGWGGGLMTWDLQVNASISNRSDINEKKDVKALNQSDFSKLNQIDPVSFKYKDDKNERDHYGFIAQQVEGVYPKLVTTTDTGKKYLNINGMIPLVVGKINSMDKQINTERLCMGDVCITKEDLIKLKRM